MNNFRLHSLSGPIQPHTEVRQLLFTDEASASPDEVDISLRVVRKAQHRPKSWRRSMLSSVHEPRGELSGLMRLLAVC